MDDIHIPERVNACMTHMHQNMCMYDIHASEHEYVCMTPVHQNLSVYDIHALEHVCVNACMTYLQIHVLIAAIGLWVIFFSLHVFLSVFLH